MRGDDDVVVVGGGAIGLCCAWYLLQAGRGVRIVEQGLVGSGSSGANCGTITPSHAGPLAAPGLRMQALRWMLQPDAPLYIRPRADPRLAGWLVRFAARCNARDYLATGRIKAALLLRSRVLLDALLAEAAIDCGFEASGMLYVYREARAWQRHPRVLEDMAAFGIDVECWDGARLEAEEPALLPGLCGALYFPGDAVLRPEQYVAGLADAVRAAGGTIEERCKITGLRCERGQVVGVDTERGARGGRDVVLAGGAWSAPLLRGLGLELPVEPGKGYSITYSEPLRRPRRPLVLAERGICVTAWKGGFRLGSTMEFSGFDSRLNATRLNALVRGASRYLHEAEGPEHVRDWYGWRPMTPDDLPVIGPVPRHRGLWLAAGHGMLGISLSPVTGHLVADLVCGRDPVIDPSQLHPTRFAGLR